MISASQEDGDEDQDGFEDVDAAVSKEREELSKLSSRPKEERRFQAVETGAQNLLFVRTTLEDPVELATAVMDGIR